MPREVPFGGKRYTKKKSVEGSEEKSLRSILSKCRGMEIKE